MTTDQPPSTVPNGVSRDVILDLLPVYLAGEASPATVSLVERHLAADPTLAAQLRASTAVAPPVLPPLPMATDIQIRTLRATRRRLALLRWLFGLAWAFAAVALSVRVTTTNGRVRGVHLLLLEHPVPFGLVASVAVVLWATYFGLRRRGGR
jgi:hypothetical protein